MPTKKPKKPKKVLMKPRTVSLMESEFHRLKNVEAKWKELCDAVAVSPHEPLSHALLTAVHQGKAAGKTAFPSGTQAVWAANWEAICDLLEVKPGDPFEKVKSLVGKVLAQSSHFRNLVATLDLPADAETAGGIMQTIRQREQNAQATATAEVGEHASKWVTLSTAFGVGPGESATYLAKFIKEKHPEDSYVDEVRRITGSPSQYTWIGLMTVLRGMRREHDEYRESIDGLRTLTAQQKVEADKWRGICNRYNVTYLVSVMDLGVRIEEREYARHQLNAGDAYKMAAKWKGYCERHGKNPTIAVLDLSEYVTIGLNSMAGKWFELCKTISAPASTATVNFVASALAASVDKAAEAKWRDLCQRYKLDHGVSAYDLGIRIEETEYARHQRNMANAYESFWQQLMLNLGLQPYATMCLAGRDAVLHATSNHVSVVKDAEKWAHATSYFGWSSSSIDSAWFIDQMNIWRTESARVHSDALQTFWKRLLIITESAKTVEMTNTACDAVATILANQKLSHGSWVQVCQHAKLPNDSSVSEVVNRLSLGPELERFWRQLSGSLGISHYAAMSGAGQDAVMNRIKGLLVDSGGWVATCQAAGTPINTNYPSVIAKLQEGKWRWLDFCKYVGIAPDVLADGALKQLLEMHKLTPPKNMAEFFRVKMPMMLDGKKRMAELVVSTQISE